MAVEITWSNFPDRFRAEAFHVFEWFLRRWRLVAAAAAAAALVGAGVGVWMWRVERREGEARTALAEINRVFRQQYPTGFYLPGGEGSEPKPDGIIQRYQQLADGQAGTGAALEARLRAGHLEYGAGAYDAAIRSYDRYLEDRRAPFRAVALLGKGYALLAKGDGAGAVGAFGAAAEAAPRDGAAAEAYLAQGRALEGLKKTEEALRAYGLVTERFPQSAWATQASERVNALK